jgi:hypothetical protein
MKTGELRRSDNSGALSDRRSILVQRDTFQPSKDSIKRYMKFYNTERFHQSLDYKTADEIYYGVFLNGDTKVVGL